MTYHPVVESKDEKELKKGEYFGTKYINLLVSLGSLGFKQCL